MWFMTGTAMALSLMVEILVLSGDIGRMNTVFKFYLQVWMLLALSAAVAVERLLHLVLSASEEIAQGESAQAPLSRHVGGGCYHRRADAAPLRDGALSRAGASGAGARPLERQSAAHVGRGSLYVLRDAIRARRGDPIARRCGRDSLASGKRERFPTIIEAQAEREYLWGNRISVYTGLPAVASWRWHQVQQRMAMPGNTVEKRQMDIRSFYNTPDPEAAWQILERYEVEYVIMTPYERAYMLPEGEMKFAPMVERGWLEVVYETPEATIYRVVP